MRGEYRPDAGRRGDDAARYESSLAYIEQSRSRRRSPWRAVFVIAVIVLVVALVTLAVISFSYLQGQSKYERLEANFDKPQQAELADYHVNWEELLAINPDTVTWIYVPNSNINYPVVRGGDNEYYLTHDFDGDQGWLANFGAIFMDYRNVPNWQDDAYFIYGHHMNDGSMFADIAQMADQAKFDECRKAYLLTPSGNFELRSFSLIHCEADDPLVQITFNTAEDMSAYVQDKMDRSVVSVSDAPKPAEVSQIFALATCDSYSSGRYVLYTYVEDETADDLSELLGLDLPSAVPSQAVSDVILEPEYEEGL